MIPLRALIRIPLRAPARGLNGVLDSTWGLGVWGVSGLGCRAGYGAYDLKLWRGATCRIPQDRRAVGALRWTTWPLAVDANSRKPS